MVLSPPNTIRMRINENTLTVLIHSDAALNLMDKNILSKLGVQYKPSESTIILKNMSQSDITIIRIVILPCVYRDNIYYMEWWIPDKQIPHNIHNKSRL